MKDLSVLQLLSYVLFLMILFTSFPTTATGLTVRADLTHVDSGRGFTKHELLRRMAARSRDRAASLLSSTRHGANTHTVTAPMARGTVGDYEYDTEYLIHFSIGTPRPQRVALTLDTGSDLVWTQCKPCGVCFDQPFPMFEPSASSSINVIPCSDPICAHVPGFSSCVLKTHECFYLYGYGDKSITAGKIVKDTTTFKAPNGKGGTVAVPEVGFGCGLFNTGIYSSNESGIAGFGRGPLSLPSQLKVGKFSYCFTTMFESKSSPVFLGTPDNLKAHATGPIQSTPFVRNPASTNYYLSLKGVTVGKTRLPVHESVFALKDGGSGGTIIDSGTGITHFPQAMYLHLRTAFVSQVRLPGRRQLLRRRRQHAVLFRGVGSGSEEGAHAEAGLPLRGRGLGPATGELHGGARRQPHQQSLPVNRRVGGQHRGDAHRQLPAAEHPHRLRLGEQ